MLNHESSNRARKKIRSACAFFEEAQAVLAGQENVQCSGLGRWSAGGRRDSCRRRRTGRRSEVLLVHPNGSFPLEFGQGGLNLLLAKRILNLSRGVFQFRMAVSRHLEENQGL